jgi:hypothetical protein
MVSNLYQLRITGLIKLCTAGIISLAISSKYLTLRSTTVKALYDKLILYRFVQVSAFYAMMAINPMLFRSVALLPVANRRWRYSCRNISKGTRGTCLSF